MGSGRRTVKATGAGPSLSVMVKWIARAASASPTGWLKRSSKSAPGSSASPEPSLAAADRRRGRAVAKVRTKGLSSTAPSSARVPAGTSTVNSVALGRCVAGVNVTPVVPTQTQCPGTSGLSTTGGRVS